MEQILILEDDIALNQGLCKALKTENRKIVSCETIKAARDQLLCGCPSLILLDINLPDGSGLDFLQELKRNYPTIPVILLTANDTDMDIVKGLELGADDYITKPFSVRELTARVKANLRRTAMPVTAPEHDDHSKDLISSGDLSINVSKYEVTKSGDPVPLTVREFELLKFLATQQEQVFSREQLLERVWGYEYFGDIRTVDVTVRRLREKIEDDSAKPSYVMTRRGVGYYFKGE